MLINRLRVNLKNDTRLTTIDQGMFKEVLGSNWNSL